MWKSFLTTYLSINHFVRGSKRALNPKHDRKVGFQNVYKVCCCCCGRSLIIFSQSREQIRPIQVMRSLLLLSFLLVVLFAALSPTMATQGVKIRVTYPKCATECCRRCDVSNEYFITMRTCKYWDRDDLEVRGCSLGYYCDHNCGDYVQFSVEL